MPRVSVILPTYNRRHLVARAIASVLAQTMSDLELIVVDDCSTDGTQAYLKSLVEPRLKIVLLDKNSGPGGARNAGLAAATAPVIAFQDSDDEWLMPFLERQLEVLDAAPAGVDACYCGKVIYGRDAMYRIGPRRAAYMPDLNRKVVEGDLYLSVLRHGIISTQTLVLRANVLRAAGGFDASLRIGLDWEMTTRLARLTRFAFIPEPLVMTYLQDDSVTLDKPQGAVTLQRILQNHRETYEANKELYAEKLFDLARIYQRTGSPNKAISPLRQALALRPTSARIWGAIIRGSMMRRS